MFNTRMRCNPASIMTYSNSLARKLLLFKCLAFFFVGIVGAQEEGASESSVSTIAEPLDSKKTKNLLEPQPITPHSMLGLIPTAQETQKDLFSLRDTFQRVTSDNLTALLNRQGVEEALQASYMERSKLFPQLNLSARQVRNQTDNVGLGLGALGNIEFPPANRFDGLIEGSLAILDLRKWADYKLAKKGYEISDASYQDLLQDILAASGQAFFNYLRDLTRLEVIEANIVRDTVLLDLAQAQFDAGVAMRLDVTRAEVRLAEDIREKLEQETRVLRSETEFKRLLNYDYSKPIALNRWGGAEPPTDLDIPLDWILSKRADYRAAILETERAKLDRKAAGWDQLPSALIFGDYGYASSDVFSNNRDSVWTVGVELTMPIFEGFRIRSNKLRTDALIREKEYYVQDLTKRIEQEYLVAVQNLKSRYQQIAITQKKLSLSQEELELARDRFENGVADNRDVVDAQNGLALTQDEYIDAVYQYNLARLALVRTLGNVWLIVEYTGESSIS